MFSQNYSKVAAEVCDNFFCTFRVMNKKVTKMTPPLLLLICKTLYILIWLHIYCTLNIPDTFVALHIFSSL